MNTLEEKRELKRLIRYLNVIDQASGELIGYTGNIHYNGLMLITKSEIALHEEIAVLVEVPGDEGVKTKIPLVIKGIWNQMNINPVFYNTGCRVVKPSQEAMREIDKLIEDLAL